MRYLVGALATLLLCGCVTPTRPVPVLESKPAAADRLLAFQEKPTGASATLVVTRDKGFWGSGCYYSLAINGTLAARLDVAETARFYLAPGEILLRSGRDPSGKALCSLDQQEWTQRETILKPDETKYFRLSIDRNGKTDIQRADEMRPAPPGNSIH